MTPLTFHPLFEGRDDAPPEPFPGRITRNTRALQLPLCIAWVVVGSCWVIGNAVATPVRIMEMCRPASVHRHTSALLRCANRAAPAVMAPAHQYAADRRWPCRKKCIAPNVSAPHEVERAERVDEHTQDEIGRDKAGHCATRLPFFDRRQLSQRF
jgi:hypothetical protein